MDIKKTVKRVQNYNKSLSVNNILNTYNKLSVLSK